MKRLHLSIVVGAAFVVAGCATRDAVRHTRADLADEVIVRVPSLFPEGVAWDEGRDRFLVTSVTRGTITAMRDDGSHEAFASDTGLTSAVGVVIDETRGRLLVAGGDFTAALDASEPGAAKLAIYDLASGKRTHVVDLASIAPAGRHSANDVAVDRDGNAFVTDILAPVIYKVTPGGVASVFLTDPQLAPTDGMGLNGIEHHPDGFQLVTLGEAVFRVPLDTPATFTRVKLSEPFAGDGLALRADGHLFVAAPYAGEVLELTSEYEWRTADVIARMKTSIPATTTGVTLRDGVPYALNAHFVEMNKRPPVNAFEIFRVRTRPVATDFQRIP